MGVDWIHIGQWQAVFYGKKALAVKQDGMWGWQAEGLWKKHFAKSSATLPLQEPLIHESSHALTDIGLKSALWFWFKH